MYFCCYIPTSKGKVPVSENPVLKKTTNQFTKGRNTHNFQKKASLCATSQPFTSQSKSIEESKEGPLKSSISQIRTYKSHVSNFKEKNIYNKITTVNQSQKELEKEIGNKLVCSVSKVDIFDESSKPIFGYPIDLEKDKFGRYWPTPLTEILSYDAFAQSIQQNFHKLDSYHTVKFISSFGQSYNYWLPIYINDEHFERGKQHILNVISIICTGIEGKKENGFAPEMVLKVLSPILVKTVIHFLKGSIHKSIAALDAYCQFYRLFVKLIEVFLELQTEINRQVESFCKSEANRHKTKAGDLGEFVIKLALSKYGLEDSNIINLVFKEHLTSQVSWALKQDRELRFRDRCPDFLKRYMRATKISNQFLLVQFEIAHLLLGDRVNEQLSKRYGFLDQEQMKVFKSRIEWIQKNVVEDWEVFVQGYGRELHH